MMTKWKFAMVTGAVHEIIALTNGLIGFLRADVGPSEFLKHANLIQSRLVEILEASLEGQKLAEDQAYEDRGDAENLFTELKAVARELYTHTNSVTQVPSLSQAQDVQKAAEHAKQVLLGMEIID
jgi:hypothetical protein